MESKKAFRYIIISYSTPIKNVLKFLAEYEDTFYKKIYDALLILLDHHQKEAPVLNREIAKTQKRMSSSKALRISVPHLRISLPRTCKTDFLKLLPWIKDDPNINLVGINQISQEVKDVLEFKKDTKAVKQEKINPTITGSKILAKPSMQSKYKEVKEITEDEINQIEKALGYVKKPDPPTINNSEINKHRLPHVIDNLVRHKAMISQEITQSYKYIKKGLWTIVMPTSTFSNDVLKSQITAIDSIIKCSKNSNYELIIVESNSEGELRSKFFEYCCKVGKNINLKYVYVQEKFNQNKMYNMGINMGRGEYINLLNADIEVITEDWLLKKEQWFKYNQEQIKNKEIIPELNLPVMPIGIISTLSFTPGMKLSNELDYGIKRRPLYSAWDIAMTADTLNKIGGNLDERFISWYQDDDIFYMCLLFNGLSSALARNIQVNHLHSGVYVREWRNKEKDPSLKNKLQLLLTNYNRNVWFNKWDELGYVEGPICSDCCDLHQHSYPHFAYVHGGFFTNNEIIGNKIKCKKDNSTLVEKTNYKGDTYYICPKCLRVYTKFTQYCPFDENHKNFLTGNINDTAGWWIGEYLGDYSNWKKELHSGGHLKLGV